MGGETRGGRGRRDGRRDERSEGERRDGRRDERSEGGEEGWEESERSEGRGDERSEGERRDRWRDGLELKSGEIKFILCVTHLHPHLYLSCTV